MERRVFLKSAAIGTLSAGIAASAFGADRYYPVKVDPGLFETINRAKDPSHKTPLEMSHSLDRVHSTERRKRAGRQDRHAVERVSEAKSILYSRPDKGRCTERQGHAHCPPALQPPRLVGERDGCGSGLRAASFYRITSSFSRRKGRLSPL